MIGVWPVFIPWVTCPVKLTHPAVTSHVPEARKQQHPIPVGGGECSSQFLRMALHRFQNEALIYMRRTFSNSHKATNTTRQMVPAPNARHSAWRDAAKRGNELHLYRHGRINQCVNANTPSSINQCIIINAPSFINRRQSAIIHGLSTPSLVSLPGP